MFLADIFSNTSGGVRSLYFTPSALLSALTVRAISSDDISTHFRRDVRRSGMGMRNATAAHSEKKEKIGLTDERETYEIQKE